MNLKKNIIIGVTGASGAIYAKALLKNIMLLKEQVNKVAVVFSDNAKLVYKYELETDYKQDTSFKIFENNDFFVPFASGSSLYDTMIICPCTMGTMGRIANGISNDLITRASDVILKERRKLILVLRETPYNIIQINNMKTITEAGGIICPANPSFYMKPADIDQLIYSVISRVLALAGFEINYQRWAESE